MRSDASLPLATSFLLRLGCTDGSIGFLSRARVDINGTDGDCSTSTAGEETDGTDIGKLHIRRVVWYANKKVLNPNVVRYVRTSLSGNVQADANNRRSEDFATTVLETRVFDEIADLERYHGKGVLWCECLAGRAIGARALCGVSRVRYAHGEA